MIKSSILDLKNVSVKLMKTENEISNDIIATNLEIQKNFPELSKYIVEMPVTIPNVENPEMTVDNLKATANH